MNGERELDNILSEKSSNNYHCHQTVMLNGVFSGTNSCSSTTGFCFPDVGSSSTPSFDNSQSPSPKSHFVDQFSSLSDSCYGNIRVNNGVFPDELGLVSQFGLMNIGNKISSDIGGFMRGTEDFRISDCNVPKIKPSNGQNYGVSGKSGFLTPLYWDELGQSGENQSSIPYSGNVSVNRNCYIDLPFEDTTLPQRDDSYANFLSTNNYPSTKVPFMRVSDNIRNGGLIHTGDGAYSHLNPQITGDPLQHMLLYEDMLPQYGTSFSRNTGALNSMDYSSQLVHYRQQALSREEELYNSMKESPLSIALMKKVRQFETYGYENALIMKKKGKSDPMILHTSMAEVQGNIYLMAKDQQGCRFLQQKFEKGSFEDVQLIFNEIIDHIVELMMNNFGNYVVQKLLDVCNEEQRMRIVHAVTRDRGELVWICLNSHGTRAVQKLIETLKTKKQISLIVRALEPGFLDLIKDLNGNHVIQRCLQCFNSDDNKLIFDASAKFCVEIGTHRHGCCVLQRCIAHSSGEHQTKLFEQICRNGLHLSQDPYGNYVVQYIIELKIPAASAQLIAQFEGHYIQLATQKFSSHVVQKCLKFIEESRAMIVYELLSVSHFEQLLQDPYANYVIQSALEVTKGPVNDSLVAAVRPHSMLRTNPYCKKIFSRGMLKK